MKRQHTNSKKGFTIIEVVLVLAIAGLIFLMVFIAFPALQRAQHDTQRTDDMARVQSALLNWQNNHSNNLPRPAAGEDHITFDATSGANGMIDPDSGEFNDKCDNQACQFMRDYMNAASSVTGTNSKNIDTFKDPDGEYYNLVITQSLATGSAPDLTNISFENGDYGGARMDIVKATSQSGIEGYTLEGQRDAYAMFIIPGATCDEDVAIRSTKNNFAVLYHMEGSGVKCTNNGS